MNETAGLGRDGSWRKLAWGAGGLAAVVVVVTFAGGVGLASRGARDLAASEAFLARGNRIGAALAARAAAEAFSPFDTVSQRGFAQLDAIARDALDHGDAASAEAAQRAYRAAELETGVSHARADGSTAPDSTVPSWVFALTAAGGLAFAAAAARLVGARR